MILLGHDQAVAEYVGRILGKPFSADVPYVAMGVLSPQGRLTGGYVFTAPNDVVTELSLAGRGVAMRSTWRAVLDYVFEQRGSSRLQVHTRKDNKVARKQITRLGFKYEGTLGGYYRDCPALIFSLLRQDVPAFRHRWRL